MCVGRNASPALSYGPCLAPAHMWWELRMPWPVALQQTNGSSSFIQLKRRSSACPTPISAKQQERLPEVARGDAVVQ